MLKRDRLIILLIVALWVLFFWRIFTPNEVDELSLTEGDFSGQIVSWTAYSVERYHAGEVPLWNPYAFAGVPFQADPQAAVFYPARLVTIGLLSLDSDITPGDIYFALELEMTLHILATTLFMYLFLRQFTIPIGSLMGALAWGYSGYLTSYPPLQLPLLETITWLPLIFWAIYRGTLNHQFHWPWLSLAGIFYAVSILAGHPQSFLLIGYLSLGYILYRLWGQDWHKIIGASAMFGGVAIGLTAFQLLPTADFQMQTTRTEIGIDERGMGFQWHELLMVLFPDNNFVSWNPLYFGIITLVVVGMAVIIKPEKFWIGVGLSGLVLIFGHNTPVYQALYLILPGFSFFRGQERNVLLLAFAMAVLAAQGTQILIQHEWQTPEKKRLNRILLGLVLVCSAFTVVLSLLRFAEPDNGTVYLALQSAIFALLISALSWLVIWQINRNESITYWQWAIVGLLVFDLFSVNMNNPFNYDPIPAKERLPEPDHIALVQSQLWPGQKVEALRGIGSSYSNLYDIPNIWGNNPLELDGTHYILWNIPIEKRWELLGVQIVYSAWSDIPAEAEKFGEGDDPEGHFNIFKLSNPRPFGLLYYDVLTVDEQDEARHALNSDINLRETVIIEKELTDTPTVSDESGRIDLLVFEPEYIELTATTSEPAIASFTLPYVRGWHAEVNGESVETFQTYGGLTGIYLEAGQHNVVLRYLPDSFVYGLVISGLTLGGLIVVFIYTRFRKRSHNTN